MNTRERVQSSRLFFTSFKPRRNWKWGALPVFFFFVCSQRLCFFFFYIIPQFHFVFSSFQKRGKPRRAARHEPFSIYITLEKRLWWNTGRGESAGAWNETLTCSIEFLKSRTAPSGSSNMKLFDGWSRVFRSNDSHHVLPPPSTSLFH